MYFPHEDCCCPPEEVYVVERKRRIEVKPADKIGYGRFVGLAALAIAGAMLLVILSLATKSASGGELQAYACYCPALLEDSPRWSPDPVAFRSGEALPCEVLRLGETADVRFQDINGVWHERFNQPVNQPSFGGPGSSVIIQDTSFVSTNREKSDALLRN